MLAIIQFDLREKLSSVSTYVYFLLFFTLSLLAMAAIGGLLPEGFGSFDEQRVNSPSRIFEIKYRTRRQNPSATTWAIRLISNARVPINVSIPDSVSVGIRHRN